MKQVTMFDAPELVEGKYTSKIEAPIYKPRGKKPYLIELCDKSKTNRLINEIKSSNLPDDEKEFLILSAFRHCAFNYELIADYYSNASKEMQEFMERSALIIIDFEKSIEFGYLKLSQEIRNQYLQEYE